MDTPTAYLKRYTNLANALHMLENKRLAFSNPIGWQDKNDTFFLEEYKRLCDYKTVFALCFMNLKRTEEKFHHWGVFTSRTDGICLHFDKKKLLELIPVSDNFRYQDVQYKTIKDLTTSGSCKSYDLPFLKRIPYKDEKEFRLIFQSKDEILIEKYIEIDITVIKKIVISPWITDEICKTIINIIRKIHGCEFIEIDKSTLVQNEAWMEFTRSL